MIMVRKFDFIVIGNRLDILYHKKRSTDTIYISCLKVTNNDKLIKDLQRLLPHTVVKACEVRPHVANKPKKKREPLKSDLVSLETFNSGNQVMVSGRKHSDKWGIETVNTMIELAKIYDLDPDVIYNYVINSSTYFGSAKSISDVCVVIEKHTGRNTINVTSSILTQFIFSIDPLTVVTAHQLRELDLGNLEAKVTDVLLGGANSLVNLIRKEFGLPILKVNQLTIDRLNSLYGMDRTILSSLIFSRNNQVVYTLKGVEHSVEFIGRGYIEYEHRKLLLKCKNTSETKTLLKIMHRAYGSTK